MSLDNHYLGDSSFEAYSKCFTKEWDNYNHKEDLLKLVNNNIDIARPIAYHFRDSYKKWMESQAPVLDMQTPLECMKTENGIKKLKTSLQRFPG
ncbi:hypothetical protein LNTAR_24923 [Lentisphaera araneosa HTCC2155]|jgi:hypothetical protein|uniref:Uncharacterized protein n=1 Tax=Lentisphaera araneosa HTCC2155 TaxID=313628 RepID=A6DSZ2_9BACT|nr:antitoxin Xre/MbcA/ParS toxin-binding domain-containing protein [Lentisphaera araneosa]EDM25282.1 hypothetical protein LNTAR_24923 [Lentisphaera araneosa HTCC2155]